MAFANSLNWRVTNGQLVVGSTNNGITSIAYSATGGTSNIVSRDSNGNTAANSLIPGYATTATAAGTTTLTVSSAQQQYFTGSSTQTVVLPVTSTLVLGQQYVIVNNSSGTVTVQSSGGNTVQAMAASTQLNLTCISTSATDATGWNSEYLTGVTFANVGSSPNAQGASISGSVITLQPASSTQPGLITAGTQTINGAKTFTGGTFTFSGGTTDNFSMTGHNTSFTGTGTSPTFTITYPTITLSNSTNAVTVSLGNTNVNSNVNINSIANFNNQFTINVGFNLNDNQNSTVTGSNADVPSTVFNMPAVEFTNASLVSIASVSTTSGKYAWFVNRTGNSIQIVDQYGSSIPGTSSNIRTGYGRNIILLNTQMVQLGYDNNSSPAQWYVAGGTYQIPLEKGVSGSLASSPVSSSTATSAFVTSLTAGTAQQNTAGYDLMVNVIVNVSSATTATLVLGIGTTSTPTTQTVIPSFTTATEQTYSFIAYVPNNYYLLVNTTGTISVSSITTMAMAI